MISRLEGNRVAMHDAQAVLDIVLTDPDLYRSAEESLRGLSGQHAPDPAILLIGSRTIREV